MDVPALTINFCGRYYRTNILNKTGSKCH